MKLLSEPMYLFQVIEKLIIRFCIEKYIKLFKILLINFVLLTLMCTKGTLQFSFIDKNNILLSSYSFYLDIYEKKPK